MGSIRRRTFTYLVSGMLCLVLVFMALSFRYFSGVITNRLQRDQSHAAQDQAGGVTMLLTDIKQNAYFLGNNDKLAQAVINAGDLSLAADTFAIGTGALNASLMQDAYAVLFIDPQFALAQLVQGDYPPGDLRRQRLYCALDAQEEAWFQKTLALDGEIYTFWDEREPENVFFAHTLRTTQLEDERYTPDLGVVLYALSRTKLLEIMVSGSVTENSISLLMQNDTPFFSSSEAFLSALQSRPNDMNALISLPHDGEVKWVMLNEAFYYVSVVAFADTWESVLLVPSEDMQNFINAPVLILLVIIAVLVIVAMMLSWLTSKPIVQPVERLSQAMKQVQDTQRLPVPVEVPDATDEIKALYNSYNTMIGQITALTQQTIDNAEKTREAELKAMQAQINPHFIYNTLDSVSCSALLEGNEDIVTMVSSLISILKYSVNYTRDTVPLREELEYLEHYIRIQQIRFRNGFRYVCDVPEKYQQVGVAQIMLQPLVENALFHARADGSPLEVRVFCEEKNGDLLIHVRDNGKGGDAEKLNDMLLTMPEKTSSHSIGIRNVNKRVKLLLGERYGLHYQAALDGGIDAVITLPLTV